MIKLERQTIFRAIVAIYTRYFACGNNANYSSGHKKCLSTRLNLLLPIIAQHLSALQLQENRQKITGIAAKTATGISIRSIVFSFVDD